MKADRNRNQEEAYQARLAVARQVRGRLLESTPQNMLAHILRTVPMSDEAGARITEVMTGCVRYLAPRSRQAAPLAMDGSGAERFRRTFSSGQLARIRAVIAGGDRG